MKFKEIGLEIYHVSKVETSSLYSAWLLTKNDEGIDMAILIAFDIPSVSRLRRVLSR